MTRIVAGVYGGRRLAVPAGDRTRPTADRVREALFSALESLVDFDGARMLDLFAGSGAVGLEALSRGAEHALLVEADPKVLRVLRENIATLGVADVASVAAGKVQTVLAAGPPGAGYGVVFVDPPYAVDEAELDAVLAALGERDWLAPDAVVVVERSRRSPEPTWPRGVEPLSGRRYGETAVWYGRRS
ncbi:16S rRNA (guanine(966)-N(2))-methyltransferase RsmD [Pilimelia columellifera]|uniref:16S rRNA (guanine(966)-N(2))-methyltransferase RsmD n=1 Tax=Pilimelia columellifera TaxID=706574 RepID=UPI0031D32B77